MERITPNTSIKSNYRPQQSSKIKSVQNGVLAEAGLTFDQAFSVPCVQFGTDILDQLAAKISDTVDTLTQYQIAAGMPESVAIANGEVVKRSINPYAGLSEACKEYGIAQHDLPADFFGIDTVKAESAPLESVIIEL